MSDLFSMGNEKTQSRQTSARGWLARGLTLIDAYPLYGLALILVLAITVSVALNLAHLPPAANAGENDTWWAIALNLIHGHGYSLCLTSYFPFCGPANQVTAAREPLPVLLFAGVAFLSGESLWAAAAVELIIYLAILIVIYFLTREWSNPRAALLAALLWAIYVPAIELIPQVSGDLLAALLVSVGMLFTLRARQKRRLRDWFIVGASFGLAAISRSGTLVIAAVVIGGVVLESWRHRFSPREIMAPALILSSLIILLMSPWLVRNKIVFGRPILGSSLIGYNLYRQNYMLGTGNYFHYVGSKEGDAAIQALLARRTDLSGMENEAQMDLVYRGEALRIIRAHPVQYGLLSAFRFLPLWFNWGYLEAYGRRVNRYDAAIMLFQGILLILALVGSWRNIQRSWPLWASILVFSLTYMALISRLLYLMPVMPLVLSLSAAGGNKLLENLLPAEPKSAS
ncbi:MAG TPA: glycosyltransferase family 39 protein [Anaerolineales bacterium]|nr:glycosyltransferase family 39 protein [Anaerolineales bacterium]